MNQRKRKEYKNGLKKAPPDFEKRILQKEVDPLKKKKFVSQEKVCPRVNSTPAGGKTRSSNLIDANSAPPRFSYTAAESLTKKLLYTAVKTSKSVAR